MTAVAQRLAAGREATRARFLLRAGLGLVALAQAELAVWGLVSPHSFYADFPGAGHHWVAALGPYNQHLIRDYAAAELGFALLLAAMAIWFERRLVLAGAAAFLLATIPHFIYHLTTTGSFSTTDNLASLGSFVLELALVAAAMVAAIRRPPDPQPGT